MVKTKSSPKDLKSRFAEYRLHMKAENKKFADGMRQIKADFQKGSKQSYAEFRESMKKNKSDLQDDTKQHSGEFIEDMGSIKRNIISGKEPDEIKENIEQEPDKGFFQTLREKNQEMNLKFEREAKEKEEARRIKRESKEDARIQRIRDSVGTKKASKGPNPFFVTLELLWVMAMSLPLLIMMILVFVFAVYLLWSFIF